MNRTLSCSLLLAAALALAAHAEFQLPDRLLYNGQTWDIAIFPLEDYPPVKTGSVSLWWEPNRIFKANQRGYIATWKLEDGRLWLTDIEACQGAFLEEYQLATLASLFPDHAGEVRIPARWFSGQILYPSHRFAAHLLPLSSERRAVQAQWSLTVVDGVVTEARTHDPQPFPATSARHPGHIEFYSYHETYELLARPEVRAELALTDEQLAALEQAEAVARAQPINHSARTRGVPAPEVSALLDMEQDQRLRELLLQMHGPSIYLATYSAHPSLLAVMASPTNLAAEASRAHGRVRNRYVDLVNGYLHRPAESEDVLELLADALEDVVHECDAALLGALPPEVLLDILRRSGEPLSIAWPRHEQRRPFPRSDRAREKAEARRGAPCSTPALPEGVELVDRDTLRLAREDIIFRRISPRRYGSAARDFFLMETEVPNRLYALYLEDTHQQKGDQELQDLLHEQEKNPSRMSTSIDPVYLINNTALLWSNNVPPESREDHPVTLIRHKDATAFCDWLNQRYPGQGIFWLPSREQWCTAAYGGMSRAYPWGDVWDITIAHISISRSKRHTEPVAVNSETRDITPEGIRHLGGNVQEYLAVNLPGDNFSAMDTSWAGSSFRSTPDDGCPPTTPRRTYWGYHHGASSRQENMGFRVALIPNGCHSLSVE